MYLIKLDNEVLNELYWFRERLKAKGIRKPIAKQVREALNNYIAKEVNGGT